MQAIPRSHHSQCGPYRTPSSHQDGVRATSYDERTPQARRVSPRSSFGDYDHISPPQQIRTPDEQQDIGPPVSSWSRTWLNTSSPDLNSSQQSSSYTSSYSHFVPVSPPKVYTPTFEQYGPDILQHPVRQDTVTTLSSSPIANTFHCPHCTKKFPTQEQFT